jgi:hypothetical protein
MSFAACLSLVQLKVSLLFLGGFSLTCVQALPPFAAGFSLIHTHDFLLFAAVFSLAHFRAFHLFVVGFSLTHIQAFLLFAAVISISFGFLGRRNPNDRFRYILWSFFLFLAAGIGIGWLMYPFSR